MRAVLCCVVSKSCFVQKKVVAGCLGSRSIYCLCLQNGWQYSSKELGPRFGRPVSGQACVLCVACCVLCVVCCVLCDALCCLVLRVVCFL